MSGVTPENILLGIKILSDLATAAAQVGDMIMKAQAEGRDITPEEREEIKLRAKSSIDSIKQHLSEREVS